MLTIEYVLLLVIVAFTSLTAIISAVYFGSQYFFDKKMDGIKSSASLLLVSILSSFLAIVSITILCLLLGRLA